MTREEAEDLIKEKLGDHFAAMVASATAEDARLIDIIAMESMAYGIEAAEGNLEAQENLEHLKAHVEVLASIVEVREGKRLNETLLAIAMIAGELLGQVLKGVA